MCFDIVRSKGLNVIECHDCKYLQNTKVVNVLADARFDLPSETSGILQPRAHAIQG